MKQNDAPDWGPLWLKHATIGSLNIIPLQNWRSLNKALVVKDISRVGSVRRTY